MGKQILNRREKLIVSNIPPEIPDTTTLVTKTDYATASKAGVVKIGSNLSVSSGKISVPVASDDTAGVVKVGDGLEITDGVLSAAGGGGVTLTELFSGNIVRGGSTPYTLSDAYTNYTFLLLCIAGASTVSSGELLPTSIISLAQYNENTFRSTDITLILRFDAEDATKFTAPSGSGTVSNVKIFGIK